MALDIGGVQTGGQDIGAVEITAASDITLTPGAASIVVTPGTPTVALSGTISLSPGSYSIVVTPGTPTVSLGGTITLAPGAATITVTPGTPTVTRTLFLAPGPAQIVVTPGTPTVSLVRTVGTGNQLYIGDTLFTCFWIESTFNITKTSSGNWSASFDLDYYGGTRPAVGQEVSMFWNSVKRWGGLIQSITEKGVQGAAGRYSRMTIKCGGYQLLTDRVIIAKLFTLFLGGLSGIVIYEIWREKLAQFGVTKIGDSPSTFIGEQLFHYITVTEAFNQVKAQDPGYDWWIDDDKLLHYEFTDPSFKSPDAPFSLDDGDRNAEQMEVMVSDVRFRNRQWVLPSAPLIALRDDARVGDGVSISFSTDYSLMSTPQVRLDSGGGPVDQVVTEFGNWIPGWQVYYIPGGIGVFFATAPGLGDAVDILYPNPFPIAVSAEDAASIADVGLYEAIWQSKNVYDLETAQAEAEGLLELYSATGYPEQIVFQYNSSDQPAWLTPGMVIAVNKTFPLAVGNYGVEQVVSQELKGKIWKHTVTLRAGPGEVTDSQALRQAQISARVPIDGPPFRATFEMFTTLPGITNPGAQTGLIPNSYAVQGPGVISSWDIVFPTDPPTGADMQLDILLNGVSIFPTGGANKMVARDGVTTTQSGTRFVTENIPVAFGDVITINVLQVGSTNPGTNATAHLNILVPANSGNS